MVDMLEDRFVGSMLGLALADALGAGHEGGIVERVAWRLLTRGELRWTDDTQMAIGLAESLVRCDGLDADKLALAWARGMDPMRGYGPGARKLLNRIRRGADWRDANRKIFPDGSFGNGAAMRAAPLGLYFHGRPDELRKATELSSSITHAHPLGIEGGLLIARAVDLALGDSFEPDTFLAELIEFCRLEDYLYRLKMARRWLKEDHDLDKARNHLGNSVLAHESAVTAVYLFCRFNDDFERLMQDVIMLGGDTDTIGAMAGGIFGALRGSKNLPKEPLERLEARSDIEALARELHAAAGAR
jgi:poly(ADP-ribose) glycohydrolase ARH3